MKMKMTAKYPKPKGGTKVRLKVVRKKSTVKNRKNTA